MVYLYIGKMATVWITCVEDGNRVVYLYRRWQLWGLPVKKMATVWFSCVEDGNFVDYLCRRWQLCGLPV